MAVTRSLIMTAADANLYTFMTANTIKCPKTSILKCADIK